MGAFQMPAASGLRGIIEGGVSARDYAAVTGIRTQDARDVLDGLVRAGIGHIADGACHFERGDRLRAAIMMLERGAPTDDVASEIDWRDFEGLAMEILASKDFAVMRNLRFKKPVIEIDVVGVRMGVAMLVDCKHWRRTAPHAMAKAVARQIDRTRRYVAETPGAVAVPVIVTLYRHETEFINNVPIVPISGFSSFVDEFYGHMDSMRTVGGVGAETSAD